MSRITAVAAAAFALVPAFAAAQDSPDLCDSMGLVAQETVELRRTGLSYASAEAEMTSRYSDASLEAAEAVPDVVAWAYYAPSDLPGGVSAVFETICVDGRPRQDDDAVTLE